MSNTREELANYAHHAWAGWMQYLFDNSRQNDDGTVTIPQWAVDRWRYQSGTAYLDLSEQEKDSDRAEADQMLRIINRHNTEQKWHKASTKRF